MAAKRPTGPEPFAVILARLRTKAGLSLGQLAERSGVSKQVIHRYEAGRLPTWRAVCRLADALGISTDVFRGG